MDAHEFETRIYIASTKPLYDEALFKKLYAQVPDYRKKKVDSYSAPKDKCLSLGAGLLLSKALAEAGYDEEELEYSFRESGMPYFKNAPEIQFSLSHSENRVMCGISLSPIGVDVEKKLEKTLGEYQQWTRIESYAKATNTSMADLLGGVTVFNTEFKFLTPDPQDGYIYCVCSDEILNLSQVKTVLFK